MGRVGRRVASPGRGDTVLLKQLDGQKGLINRVNAASDVCLEAGDEGAKELNIDKLVEKGKELVEKLKAVDIALLKWTTATVEAEQAKANGFFNDATAYLETLQLTDETVSGIVADRKATLGCSVTLQSRVVMLFCLCLCADALSVVVCYLLF